MHSKHSKAVADRPVKAKRAGKAVAARKLLEYLPAIYQETNEGEESTFVGQLLTPFGRILLGGEEDASELGDVELKKGLEEEIAALPELFDPGKTPEEFLPWLASWAALSFRPELDETRRRRLLARIIQLYRIRGTRKYLEDLLQLCVDASVSVNDAEIPGFQLERHSTVGVDAYIGGGPPHFFSVTLRAPKLSWEEKEKQIAIAHSIIELAKPAHTFYELSVDSPQFQIGVHSTVGVDTVLGAPE